MGNFKIVWDKGHGGEDPGAIANGMKEKNLTHEIVEHAMAYLTANYTGFSQMTTRGYDKTVPLEDRDDIADNWGADIFVSVHINAGGGTGFETFIYNGGASEKTVALQNVLHNEILSTMRKFGDIKDRGNKKANYAVLRETKAPAVLTENLFIDTGADATKLKKPEFIKAVGQAHARGVAKYLGLKEKEKKVDPVKTVTEKGTFYRVVTGSFADQDKAEARVKELRAKGFESFIDVYKK